MKLSGTQIVWIMATTEMVAIIGLRISPAIQIAEQDAWLSILLGGIIGLALTLLLVHLSILNPNQTLVQYSQVLLGKWAGRFIVIPYLIAWYILSAVLLRSFANFVHLIILNETPVWLIMLILIGQMIYLTHSSGITGIGRFCELIGPIIVFTLIISFLLNVKNMELHNLLPVFSDSGWGTIFKGSIAPAFWFPGPFVLLVIVSFLQNPKNAYSKSIIGVGITIIMVLASTLMVLLVFGPNLSAKIRFSYFVSIKTIDILDFIQNLDIFIMFVWIFGVIAQSSLYFFIASFEMANVFKVKNWRKLIWFGAPTIFCIAIIIPNDAAIGLFDHYWTSVIFPVLGIAIPLFLWMITVVKKKRLESKV